MAKPIFVVRLGWIDEYEHLQLIKSSFVRKLNDYHVIFVQEERDEVGFELYNTRKILPVKLKVLKDMVKIIEKQYEERLKDYEKEQSLPDK